MGPAFSEFVSFSYIAHFVEVRIEPVTRRIRVPRVVSIVDCARVVSPRTATSQVHGGVVWGIGAALREGSEVDPRFGGFLNADIAEYVVPVNADIGAIGVDFIDKPDPRNIKEATHERYPLTRGEKRIAKREEHAEAHLPRTLGVRQIELAV
jgi:xanthine dehydrogenase YagR molybdenum-binding subunit